MASLEENEKPSTLPVMEHFYTLQGEGCHSGTAAYFVRLGGCEVGCHWCDVKESWDAGLHELMAESVIASIAAMHCKTVVITGGEPLMWKLDSLTDSLKQKSCTIHLETSGAYNLSGIWDWICLSPKKRQLPKQDIYPYANELKIIIYNQDDFLFAQQQAKKVSPTCKLFLQAEWSKSKEMNSRIVEFVKQNPQWRLSMQTHKYLEIP